jgi:hypothetical protein
MLGEVVVAPTGEHERRNAIRPSQGVPESPCRLRRGHFSGGRSPLTTGAGIRAHRHKVRPNPDPSIRRAGSRLTTMFCVPPLPLIGTVGASTVRPGARHGMVFYWQGAGRW